MSLEKTKKPPNWWFFDLDAQSMDEELNVFFLSLDKVNFLI